MGKKLHLLVEDALDEQDPVDLTVNDQVRRVRYTATACPRYVAKMQREQSVPRRRQFPGRRGPRVIAKKLEPSNEKITVSLPGVGTEIRLAPIQDFLDVGASERRDE